MAVRARRWASHSSTQRRGALAAGRRDGASEMSGVWASLTRDRGSASLTVTGAPDGGPLDHATGSGHQLVDLHEAVRVLLADRGP
jgi:hypothetical protein